MVSRIVRPETALPFTPAPLGEDTDLLLYLTGYPASTVYFDPVEKGAPPVTLGTYFTHFCAGVKELMAECAAQGFPFAWENTIGEVSFPEYALMAANTTSVIEAWRSLHAQDSYDTAGYLSAKHLLVGTEAEALFDTLMAAHSKDGRSESGALLTPEGYTFTTGEMVHEFEAGAKALKPGEISPPIQSQFGYHLILRLPLDEQEARRALEEKALEQALGQIALTLNEVGRSIDVVSLFDAYLALETT